MNNVTTPVHIHGAQKYGLIQVFFYVLATLFLLSSPSHTEATVNNREDAKLINHGWSYLQQAVTTPTQALAMNGWQSVVLPHTWNATDSVDLTPGYRRDASWYRRSLTVPEDKNQRHWLYFEGANMETQVYVNGELAGEHVGGYLGFEIELSQLLHYGKKNNILVRVSNRYNPNLIPSQKADFFQYGGITRDVWHKSTPRHHLSRVLVDTQHIDQHRAEASFTIQGRRPLAGTGRYILEAHLYSPGGELVGSARKELDTDASEFETGIPLPALHRPELWSVDTPRLYTAEARLLDTTGRVLHSISEKYGFRWFEMRPDQGFFLNGKRLLLRGTHRHEEHAGLGAAMPNEMHRRDMEMIKAMGANFLRLAHYPQDPEVYRAADELGLILWDELPWCRGGKGGREWEENTERVWQQQVLQNRNHPSIAFWSLGNEVFWQEDFPGGGEEKMLIPYLEKLNSMTKSWDNSRLTSIRKLPSAAHIVDVYSPSIWAGWYGGSYSQYQGALDHYQQEFPRMLHMEYGGSSHAGRHTETPISPNGMPGQQISVAEAVNQAAVSNIAKGSDWSENYIVNLFDWYLQISENRPEFSGNAQWAFKDFGTPLRPDNPIPYINQKGLLDRNGNPKDGYYVFASYWAKEPFCYIESKTWTHRMGPAEGRDVKVYCNTDSAELFLNGVSLGKKTKQPTVFPAGGLVWKVPFKEGQNRLAVRGYRDELKVADDSQDVNYHIGRHGRFDHVRLTIKPLANGNRLVIVEALDKNNLRVLNYSEPVYFSNLSGQGQLLKDQGTPTGSEKIEMANGYATIEYIPGNKASTIEVRSQNIKGAYISVK